MRQRRQVLDSKGFTGFSSRRLLGSGTVEAGPPSSGLTLHARSSGDPHKTQKNHIQGSSDFCVGTPGGPKGEATAVKVDGDLEVLEGCPGSGVGQSTELKPNQLEFFA
jgi:hypothetical protein